MRLNGSDEECVKLNAKAYSGILPIPNNNTKQVYFMTGLTISNTLFSVMSSELITTLRTIWSEVRGELG